jgi:hypothetical protein
MVDILQETAIALSQHLQLQGIALDSRYNCPSISLVQHLIQFCLRLHLYDAPIRQYAHPVEDEIVSWLESRKRLQEIPNGKIFPTREVITLPLAELIYASLVIVLKDSQEGNSSHVELLYH